MSSAHAHVHANASGRDPTQTTTVRKRYAQRLRGQLAKLNAVIREAIVERDIFGLKSDTVIGNQSDPTPPPTFRFLTDDEKIDQFIDWLERQERRGVLEVIERGENPYIRSAYRRGLRNATRDLQDAGVEVDTSNIDDIFNLGVHQDTLQRLYTRNFRELEGITQEMNRQISRQLADGFAQGHNPRKIARNISDRVNKIGKTRATVMARTEVIRSHSESQMNRFERMGVENITVQAEWLTAGDSRVCPICQSLEGNTWTIQEAREATIRLTEDDVSSYVPENRSASSFTGEFPVRPPAHPQCRCRLIPEVRN